MSRLHTIDRVLLLVLVPLWCVVFTLHVREIQRTGAAQVPVFASPGRGADAYPTVGGFRLERESSGTGLEIGDRLIRVGSVDLRGRGYFGFDAVAFDVAGPSLNAPLVIERGGSRYETTLTLRPSPAPWFRIPFLLSFAAIAVIVMLRAVRSPATRLFFAGSMCLVIFETPFEGGPPVQTYFAYGVFYLFGPTSLFLLLRWATLFPDEILPRDRVSAAWSWVAALFLISRMSYVFGGPVPTAIVPYAVILSDAVFFSVVLGIMSWNYTKADPVGRRRIKWVILGAYLAGLPNILGMVGTALGVDFMRYDEMLIINVAVGAIFPAGMLIAILRYRLYDIDRILSATACYSVLAALVFGGAATVVPPIARAVSALLGFDEGSGQVAFSALLAATAVPAQRRLRPQIDRFLFRERFALDHGIAALLAALPNCKDARSLTERVGEALYHLLRSEVCVVYANIDASYVPVFVEGRAVPPAFEATGSLIAALRGRRGPISLDDLSRRRNASALGPFERAALETLNAEVVLPVRYGDDLLAFVCLGQKRSRDVYTSTDLSLLNAVAEKLSSELLRFDQEEVIREGREMQQSLRRYVPGAIAEELAAGSDLETGEREVSVLFVDIRGYTKLSEGRRPEEIFSTVNRYTEIVSRIVRKHGGSVVEFNGDGMMTVFGAPRELVQKERAAVEAAVEIFDSVGSVRVEIADGEMSSLSVGVGVATGPAFVGNIQAVDRMIWSAIGNTTNLAARLEGLTRDLDAAVVIDAGTWSEADDAARSFARCEPMAIRGRSQLMDLYALPLASPENDSTG